MARNEANYEIKRCIQKRNTKGKKHSVVKNVFFLLNALRKLGATE